MNERSLTVAALLDEQPPDSTIEGFWAAKARLRAAIGAAWIQQGSRLDEPLLGFWVPGRIEVLGKHTDYAGGRSLLAATGHGFLLTATPREDGLLRLVDAARGEAAEFPITPDLAPQLGHWSNYPMTVARRLARNFRPPLAGAQIVFASDLPSAAGMSSSSAFMIGVFLVLHTVNELIAQPAYADNINTMLDLADYLGTVENGQSFRGLVGDKGVGTFGGSEDHTAILTCKANTLSRYAFCPSRFELDAPMPAGMTFAVGVSGVVAAKTANAREQYNRASALAGAVTSAWRAGTGHAAPHMAAILAETGNDPAPVRAILRNTADAAFSAAELLRRFEHFVVEHVDVIPAAGVALQSGDLSRFGAVVADSQEQCARLLGNQVPETIALAESAVDEGAVAASAFGAGFGGSVWAMVDSARSAEFLAGWRARYLARFPERDGAARFFLTPAGPSAHPLSGSLRPRQPGIW